MALPSFRTFVFTSPSVAAVLLVDVSVVVVVVVPGVGLDGDETILASALKHECVLTRFVVMTSA